MQGQQTNVRRAVTVVLAMVVFLVLLGWAWHYMHTSKLVIRTKDPSVTITLYRMPGSGSAESAKIAAGHSSLTANLSYGEYKVIVAGNSQSAIQLVKVQSHKTYTYEIDPKNTTGVEPVIYKNAQDVVEANHQLLYLDAADANIYKVDANNTLSTFVTQALQTVKWSNPSLGIGQDANSHLYSIVNGSSSPLKIPFSYGSNPVRYDVSKNGQVFLASGADIYQGSVAGNFRKIYTVDSSNLVLAASDNNVAIASSKLSQGNASKPALTVLNASGKIVANTQIGGDIGKLIWSSDGKYLVSFNESSAKIYDASLRVISSIPAPAAVSYVGWYASDKLIFSSNDQLWSYNLTGQRADLIANMPLGSPVTSIAIGNDGSYVYLTTLDSSTGGNSAIRRVSLNNQTVPKYVYQLQSILPLNLGLCNLSILNFTRPTVLVQSDPSQAQQCQQQAKSELQKRGFDLNSLQLSSSS